MSYVTHVLIHGNVKKQIEALNEWLREADADRHQQFNEISFDAAGGNKYYVNDVWAAAFNYGPVGELREKLLDPATWGHSVLMVAVIIDGEEIAEAWVFDRDENGVYRAVTSQEYRQ